MDAQPTSSDSNPLVARDRISVAIESHLRVLGAKGWCELQAYEDAAGVHVSFGSSRACGEDYDIALVRLARALIEDAEFSGALMATLRGLMVEAGTV